MQADATCVAPAIGYEPSMQNLNGKHVAALVCDGFEEVELTQTVKALRDAGAVVDIISEKREPLQAFQHLKPSITVTPDKTFGEVKPESYDALLLPGGGLNADAIRMLPQAQAFVKSFDAAQKPIAAICHAPWLLVSAGVAEGRHLTSYSTIQDDLKNAGAQWSDQAVVVDRNLVTSRQPDDIPQFNKAMIELIAQGTPATATVR